MHGETIIADSYQPLEITEITADILLSWTGAAVRFMYKYKCFKSSKSKMNAEKQLPGNRNP